MVTEEHGSDVPGRGMCRATAQDVSLQPPATHSISHPFLQAAAGDAKLQWADATPPAGTPAGLGCRAFKLPQPLAPKGRLSLEADAIFTHVLRPEPAQIKQNEPQRVVYEDSALLPSPYRVEKQSTEVGREGRLQRLAGGSVACACCGAAAGGQNSWQGRAAGLPSSVRFPTDA